MKPSARLGDMHVCSLASHAGGPILPACCPTVLIGGLPAARAGDHTRCRGRLDRVAQGSATVLVGGLPAARLGDQTEQGGRIVTGCPTVLIGD